MGLVAEQAARGESHLASAPLAVSVALGTIVYGIVCRIIHR